MKKTKSKKPKSLKQLKKEADAIFSKFIRIRDNATCFTCGVKREVKEMQDGHYIPRNILATRFCEINNNCQCLRCNHKFFLGGNYPMYSLNLTRKYGPQILEELERKKNIPTKYSRSDYEELIEKYKQKVRDLCTN